MNLRWKLQQYLDHHNITPNALARETEGQLSRNSIYNLARGEPRGINFESLAVLIKALRDLTGKPVTPNDLIEYVEE